MRFAGSQIFFSKASLSEKNSGMTNSKFIIQTSGYNISVLYDLPKVERRVRLPLPALN